MRFSGVLFFISGLLPFLQSAEQIFGPGNGKKKKKYVDDRLRTLTAVAQQRLGISDELDPAVKENRGDLIDIAVEEAILHGDLPGTEEQRMKAGLSLGFVTDNKVVRAYGKLQNGASLSSADKETLDAYREILPPIPSAQDHRREGPGDPPPAAAAGGRKKARSK